MIRLAAALLILLASLCGVAFGLPFPMLPSQVSQAVQNLVSISPTSFTYTTGISSGTAIGTVAGMLSTTAGSTITYSLSGSNAGDFTINSSTGVITANGSTPTCGSTTLLTNINAVATDHNAYGSPLTQALSITCVTYQNAFLYHHITTSTNTVGVGVSYIGPWTMHVESLPANTVAVLAVTLPQSVSTVSVSDTLAGSWSSDVCTATGGSGNYTTWLFVQPLGSTGGADLVSISTGSSSIIPFQFVLSFFENISTSSPVDGYFCTASGGITANSSGVITPTAFTPSTNNDANGGHVIWSYVGQCAGTGSLTTTGWTAGSGFTLLNGDIAWTQNGVSAFYDASEWQIQATNASIAPAFTATGETTSGDCFNSISVALLLSSSGATAPTAIHVENILHEASADETSPFTLNNVTPFTGNLRVAAFTWPGGSPGGGAPIISSLSSTDSCTWHKTTNSGSGGGAEIFYAQGCSACPTCKTSLVFTGAGTLPNYSYRIYDVDNAQTSSYSTDVASSGSCVVGTNTDQPAITPSISAGMTIAVSGFGTGPATLQAGSPSGAVYDIWSASNYDDSDNADNDDSSAHYYFSTNATQHWDYTGTHTSTCYWDAATFQ
jgi:hypothetical protein